MGNNVRGENVLRILDDAAVYLGIKTDNGDDYFRKGNVLFDENQGKLDEAIVQSDMAIKINPNDANYHFIKGNVMFRQGKLDEAIVQYDKAIIINPNNADYYSSKGIALQYQGKLDEAIVQFDMAIKVDPSDPEYYNYKGIVLQHQGKLDEAIIQYDMAIKIDPSDAVWYDNKGLVLQQQDKLDEAIEQFDMAILIDPNAYLYFNKGIALQHQSKLDEAIVQYDMAIKINPNDADCYNNKGNQLFLQGKLSESLQCFESALSLDPSFLPAKTNQSLVLEQLERESNTLGPYQNDKHLKLTNFKTSYSTKLTPRSIDQLFQSIKNLLVFYTNKNDIKDVDSVDLKNFLDRLRRNLEKEKRSELDDIPACCQNLWSSEVTLSDNHQVELCSIINWGIRNDFLPTMDFLIPICCGMNTLLINRKTEDLFPWPKNNTLYRGGGLPEQYQIFFTVGKRYRCPMYLATSQKPTVMERFAIRARKQNPMVHWIIHIDPKFKCDHVSLLRHGIQSEWEFLFVPYSVFVVQQVVWSSNPHDPHVIEIYAEPDNKNPHLKDDEEEPLAPWH